MDLMSTQPSSLLAKDRYLLSEDFHALGEGPAAIRQVWVASMESALGAAEKYASGTLVSGSLPYLQVSFHWPHRFTRRNRQTSMCQPNPKAYKPDNTPQTPSTTPQSLQRHLQMTCERRRRTPTTPYGDIRRQRRDSGSCIYKKDWRIK